MSATVLRADARSLPLPDATVDLLLCSPPYFSLRSYTDGGEHYEGQIGSEATPREWLASMLECTAEWVRVLKPSGSIWVNLGDKFAGSGGDGDSGLITPKYKGNTEAAPPSGGKCWGAPAKSLLGLPWRYALACMDDLGLTLRRDIVWHKVNSLPESVVDRCATRHEYLFHFVKQPRYYAAVDEIREPHVTDAHSPGNRRDGVTAEQVRGKACASKGLSGQYARPGRVWGSALGKLPGSVWEIPSQPLIIPDRISHARCCGGRKREGCTDGLDHFAAFPMELPRRLILGWSPPGICTACGEGRRPVARRSQEPTGRVNSGRAKRQTAGGIGLSRGFNAAGYPHTVSQTSISGYACSCTPCTDHPASERASNRRDRAPEGSQPHGDYARKQAGEYERVGPWREYHLDGWDAPPARAAIVADPFGGTGTTALVADVLGRHGLSFDRSGDYCRLATWRTTDPGERAKAMQVPRPAVVPDDQEALFGLGEVS